MTTRTYRINLVGEPADTSRALAALERLFDGEALTLLREDLGAEGLTVQRLVADSSEVVLYIIPEPAAQPEPWIQQVAASSPNVESETQDTGGTPMGSEDPPP